MLLFFKPEFIKEAYSKYLYPWYLKVFYPNKYRFYFLLDFAWTTPTKYDDHPYHPNIGSTSPSIPPPPPPPPGHYLVSNKFGLFISNKNYVSQNFQNLNTAESVILKVSATSSQMELERLNYLECHYLLS